VGILLKGENLVPLVRIDAPMDRSAAELRALGDSVHRAMVETLGVPAEDKFQVVTGHASGVLNVTPSYLGVAHGEGMVIVQITLNQGRSIEQKKALYRRLADELHAGQGVRKEDVIVSLVEVSKENWSFGSGDAQYAP